MLPARSKSSGVSSTKFVVVAERMNFSFSSTLQMKGMLVLIPRIRNSRRALSSFFRAISKFAPLAVSFTMSES